DGIEQWRVVGYGGVTPIVRGYVAAAVRRRGPDRRLRTAGEASRELAITRLASLAEPLRRALAASGVDVVELAEADVGQPGRAVAATLARAAAVSAWLLRERAPVSTPDARWDRLLYPIHDVETYLRSRTPRDVIAPRGSRLPRTGS